MKLPIDLYRKLSEKVDKVRQEVDSYRPEPEFLLITQSKRDGDYLRTMEFYTEEEMQQQIDLMTMNGEYNDWYFTKCKMLGKIK